MAVLSIHVRDKIEEMIALGTLRPGQPLHEAAFASHFSVSRTVIRESLFQLAQIGLVVMRPHRSAIVAKITPQRLVEMFEVMAELEAMCGRLAARRFSEEDRHKILEKLDGCRSAQIAGDSDRYYYENEAFHKALYDASHNRFLVEHTENLHRRLRPYRRLQLRVRDRLTTSLAEHEAIVQALFEGDEVEVYRLITEHIVIQGQRFADLISTLTQFEEEES
jgi:DNA-binding GntR family transcriptional regulator